MLNEPNNGFSATIVEVAHEDNMFPVTFGVPAKDKFDYLIIDLQLQTVS